MTSLLPFMNNFDICIIKLLVKILIVHIFSILTSYLEPSLCLLIKLFVLLQLFEKCIFTVQNFSNKAWVFFRLFKEPIIGILL